MKRFLVLAAAAASFGSPAVAAPAPAVPEARLVFPNNATIRTFEAVSNDVVYIQGRNRQWYRATLFGPCFGLRFALGIGIANRGLNVLERGSDLLVEGQRCKIMSFVKSGPPPKDEKRRRR